MSKGQKNLKYEDTIQCYLFSTKKYSNAEWQQQCDSINETIKILSQEYLWHRDEFKVFLPINKENNDIPLHLMGLVCFGDNIEDEWFIVYLLFEITKKYPDFIIKTEDNDGDFLLIEAANYLPTWANPDTTENRVFLYESNLHLISPNIVPVDSSLKLIEALTIIAKKSEQTKATFEIQQAIYNRIKNYPHQIKKHSHKAIVKLPLEVATVLTVKPSLISPFVNAFCSLDALDAKLCNKLETDGYIEVGVKFTKFLYAMLMHTKFPNSFKIKTLAKEKKTELGLKVLCGYKTIMSKTTEDVFSTSEYRNFINSLSKNGYFKNNMESSKEHTKLLNEAKRFFNMECPINSQISNVIKEIKLTDEFKNTETFLKQKYDVHLEEDDDSWLNVNPDDLNEFLNSQYGRKIKLKNNDPVTSHIITSELTYFLKERSDLEGVEETVIEDGEEKNIDFNSDEFTNCLEKMLNIISNNNVTIDSDQSDFSDNDDSTFDEINKEHLDSDRELASKLITINEHSENSEKSVLQNFIHGLKEEGLSGPTSTVLRTIGIKKSDLIDSDDDDDDIE